MRHVPHRCRHRARTGADGHTLSKNSRKHDSSEGGRLCSPAERAKGVEKRAYRLGRERAEHTPGARGGVRCGLTPSYSPGWGKHTSSLRPRDLQFAIEGM